MVNENDYALDHLQLMAQAIAEAQRAADAGEVPVGAVVVRDTTNRDGGTLEFSATG